MRPKSLILLSLALGCGLVAALGINQMMAKQQPSTAGTGEMQDIVVAVADININDLLPLESVKLEPWPKDKVRPGSLFTLKDIEGRRAKSKIYSGEAIVEERLLAKGESHQSATDHIPAGLRVVSVKVDAVSATGHLIRPGDRVDMLVHIPQNLGMGVPQAMTKTFLQDVRVFAVNDVIARDPADGQARITAQTVSLLVKPEDVELVTQASEMGRLRLSMRGPTDETIEDTPGADVAQIIRGESKGADKMEPVQKPEVASSSFSDFLKQFKTNMSPSTAPTELAQIPLSANKFQMRYLRGTEIEHFEVDESGQFPVVTPGTGERPVEEPILSSAPETDNPAPADDAPAPVERLDRD